MQQFEKDKFLKDLEELKNLDLLQYKYCNIMYHNDKIFLLRYKIYLIKYCQKKKQN